MSSRIPVQYQPAACMSGAASTELGFSPVLHSLNAQHVVCRTALIVPSAPANRIMLSYTQVTPVAHSFNGNHRI